MSEVAGQKPALHLMHHFGRKCDYCGRMTWPGMEGSAKNVTDDQEVWRNDPDACNKVSEERRYA